MAKKPIPWDKIRAEYEAGSSQSDLFRKYEVSRAAIQKHIAQDHWTQDLGPVIARKVEERVAGIVAGGNPAERAIAIDAAALRVVEVIERHRTEWEEHKGVIDRAVGTEDLDAAKLAKILAETLKIRQEGERKAWGIQDSAIRVEQHTTMQNDLTGDDLILELQRRGLPTAIFEE
jgi:hypothetical protein